MFAYWTFLPRIHSPFGLYVRTLCAVYESLYRNSAEGFDIVAIRCRPFLHRRIPPTRQPGNPNRLFLSLSLSLSLSVYVSEFIYPLSSLCNLPKAPPPPPGERGSLCFHRRDSTYTNTLFPGPCSNTRVFEKKKRVLHPNPGNSLSSVPDILTWCQPRPPPK